MISSSPLERFTPLLYSRSAAGRFHNPRKYGFLIDGGAWPESGCLTPIPDGGKLSFGIGMMASPMIAIRTATESDADAITRLVNTAFLAERFFIERDRTNPATVRGLMEEGKFLLA